MFLLAYDQVKAYDSVQGYTIKASLERFNLPDAFITYVLSNLEDATSCFKTFFGPTEEFLIETSVRQGDPLSPLIYIFVTDALHEGLSYNPIFKCKTGYSFSNQPSLRVASLGYADDTLTCNESWKDQWMSHEWVRDFCHAHNFRLNSSKSRYIISNFMGPSDGRYLWSVDGSEIIRPLPSSTTFRYLGLWLSMNLDWSKQIHVLNKSIADWKWKAFANNIDPAQLRTSYVEFLLPRLEIGLLHANLTEQMCNAWTASIIYTLCQRGGFGNGHSLNRMAFCLLAGIPDIWLHLNTVRATELLCSLNSKNSDAGLSTAARFCAMARCSDLHSAAKVLERRSKFSKTSNYRIGSCLKYFKELGVKLTSPTEPSLDNSKIIEEIRSNLQEVKGSAIIYTDGSTSTQGKFSNSGSGIFITDDQHVPLWSGGFIVRSDGNNFIAELAAAAVVLKACPTDLPVTLRIDSMATIGALSKGTVSERKRIRAAGRAWLNYCRTEIREKCFLLEHVSSHTGSQSPEQKGNDAADRMANKFRLHGESIGPVPYLISSEEVLILQHQGTNVQGDPRGFLKKMAKEKMVNIWKTKSKQAKWFKKFPTQILQQAKLVWKWSIESGYGQAWLYFIFAICQWLPTNYRIHYQNSEDKKRCSLCISGEQEDMNHILHCPAFTMEHVHIREVIHSKIELWKIPYGSLPFVSREVTLRMKWKNAARERFAPEALSSSQLDNLTLNFWKCNQQKTFISTRIFIEKLSAMLTHQSYPPLSRQPRHDLLNTLIQELSLQTQGLTDSLHISPLFSDWTSVRAVDVPFGAKLWSTSSFHQGSNTFFFHGPKDEVNSQGLLEVLSESLCTNLPTRFVCLIPSQEKLPPYFHELAILDRGAPLFGFKDDEGSRSDCQMSIILAANKESLQIDPINWETLTTKLKNWSIDHIIIPQQTDNLFQERKFPSHPPRSLSKQVESANLKTPLINFFYPQAPMEKPQNTSSIPPRALELIVRMNQHPRFLSLLGIVPNHFRTLLKETAFENREEAISDLRRTLFFAGFSLWNKRQKLSSQFWNDISPENINNKKKMRKKREREQAIVASNCRNPFHFLTRYRNLTNMLRTPCLCSTISQKPSSQSIDIPRTLQIPNRTRTRSETFLILSRTDKIRAEHDRRKRRKAPKVQSSEKRPHKYQRNK